MPADKTQRLANLDDSRVVDRIVQDLGCADVARTSSVLKQIREVGLTEDLLAMLIRQLSGVLPKCADPDGVFCHLHRFIAASRSPQSLVSLFERDPDSLTSLITILSTSQYLAEQLVRDPEVFDLLRLTDGQCVAREILVDEMATEIDATTDEGQVLRTLRSYKHRETMRIAYSDFVCQMPLETVTEQISSLAEAILEAALRAAWRDSIAKRGRPLRPDGTPARLAVIALGKLGGAELNYSSDIDLMFVADTQGQTDHARPVENLEFFERLARSLIKLLGETTPLGHAYRVDMRLRPFGSGGPLVVGAEEALHYYDTSGRTWERQAFVKARAVAGHVDLGQEFIHDLQPWIFRTFLTRADISGLSSLKRRMERRSRESGRDDRNVKNGHGGIRDIEFAIQFLQLLNGSETELVRTSNTLEAIAKLQQHGCLNPSERSALEENYRFLRRIEHRIQIMYDSQTHVLPEDEDLQRFALRAGYHDKPNLSAARQFTDEYEKRTGENRKMLDHLLHQAFGLDVDGSDEGDLILDPEPNPEAIERVLSKYGFNDLQKAYQLLVELSSETIAFLSTRRCRHFLAAIAPRLLEAISSTPAPDETLLKLTQVSESIGGKAVLWELFSVNAPSLELCVRLCSCSPYLVGILVGNPGMIDELIDSLMLDRLPTFEELDEQLTQTCRNAEDISPMLHSFKGSMHLRVGIRDILGKESIEDTHRCLAQIAEVCLKQVIDFEYHKLVRKLGLPIVGEETKTGSPAELIVLAVGKLGGSEPNYHSDLDLLFLFDHDGQTRALVPSRKYESTTNRHFFNELAQRVVRSMTSLGTGGRLYDVDARLRPSGISGVLALTVGDLETYFLQGHGQLWERQSLCKARVVWGSTGGRAQAELAVRKILTDLTWRPEMTGQMRHLRYRYQQGASSSNLKRSVGGTVDIEFIVQMLQLQHAQRLPELLEPNTMEAIRKVCDQGLVSVELGNQLRLNYRFLRSIESGLRLMDLTARHDLPSHPEQLRQLAFLLDYQEDESIFERCQRIRTENRELFESFFAEGEAQ